MLMRLWNICLDVCGVYRLDQQHQLPLQEEGITLSNAAAKDVDGTPSDMEMRFLAAVQKQYRPLYPCAYLLLNLPEDADMERKMQKKVSCALLHISKLCYSSGRDIECEVQKKLSFALQGHRLGNTSKLKLRVLLAHAKLATLGATLAHSSSVGLQEL